MLQHQAGYRAKFLFKLRLSLIAYALEPRHPRMPLSVPRDWNPYFVVLNHQCRFRASCFPGALGVPSPVELGGWQCPEEWSRVNSSAG